MNVIPSSMVDAWPTGKAAVLRQPASSFKIKPSLLPPPWWLINLFQMLLIKSHSMYLKTQITVTVLSLWSGNKTTFSFTALLLLPWTTEQSQSNLDKMDLQHMCRLNKTCHFLRQSGWRKEIASCPMQGRNGASKLQRVDGRAYIVWRLCSSPRKLQGQTSLRHEKSLNLPVSDKVRAAHLPHRKWIRHQEPGSPRTSSTSGSHFNSFKYSGKFFKKRKDNQERSH